MKATGTRPLREEVLRKPGCCVSVMKQETAGREEPNKMGWSWVMGRVPGGRGQHWAGRCTAIPRDAHLAPLFPPFMFHMLICESSSPDPAWQPWFVQTPPRTLTCPSLPCRGQVPGHERVFCAGEGKQRRGLDGLGVCPLASTFWPPPCPMCSAGCGLSNSSILAHPPLLGVLHGPAEVLLPWQGPE